MSYASVKATKDRKAQFVRAFKSEQGCADCGETDPIVLELDHRDPATKDLRLRFSTAGNKKISLLHFSWADLYEELKKCDVVCANCHRRRTARQQGWLKTG